jgi:nanoRNase/pAp phosphatase (c-di-AMP/oligoRNAs hydrolase)
MNNETMNHLTYDQAFDLVERIAERTKNFNHEMESNEMKAMAELLSEIGVSTSDLIDVSNLADEYSVNAEIVTALEAHDYSQSSLDDALFTWKDENGDTCYCLSW